MSEKLANVLQMDVMTVYANKQLVMEGKLAAWDVNFESILRWDKWDEETAKVMPWCMVIEHPEETAEKTK